MKKNYKYAVLTLVVGIVAGILLMRFSNGEVDSQNRVMRNEFGEGPLEVEMEVEGDKFSAQMTYTVEERRYTKDEIEKMLPDFWEVLEQTVAGSGDTEGQTDGNLIFLEEIEGYPFTLIYETDRSDLLARDGERLVEVKEVVPVEIMVTASYEELQYIHIFYVNLLPVEQDSPEAWRKRLEELLVRNEEANREEAYFYLPEQLEGETLHWKSPKKSKGGIVILLSIVISGVLFASEYMQKRELEKKRKEEIVDSYPAFALRYSMLVAAGLTLRQALQRISGTAGEKALYQEVKRGVYELEAGVSEGAVYENIGQRCNTPQMRKFGTLLASNLRKGQEGLSELLREEATQAMAQKRESIRKKGETAGTKLLFPMLLLLLIVFVIIMVPAFSSFTF